MKTEEKTEEKTNEQSLIQSKEVEKLEKSAARLSVTVGKDKAKEEYDNLLKQYAKQAQIKGFRKGKVPPSVLEQKYGEGIRQEAAGNLIDNSLKEAFASIEESPLSFAQPELESMPDLRFDTDFSYSVKYDIYPEISLGEYKGLEAEEPQVSITQTDIKAELEKIQDQNSVVMDKEDKTVTDGSIVTINYSEVDGNGEPVAGTSREDFVFTLGSGYNFYKLDEDIQGMKVDEEKVIEKTYPEDEENQELAGQTKQIKVKVTAVKEKQLPEINDELAQDVDDKFETLDDLKKDIRKRFKENADAKVREKKLEQILNQVVENSTVELPESMIQADLDNSWQSFVSQSRMPEETILQMLQMQGKTKEDMMSEWREDAVKSLKQRLLTNKMVEQEKIEVSDEEVDKEIKDQAEKSGMPEDEVRKYLKQNNLMDHISSQIKDRKLFDILLEEAKVKKGSKVKYLDLVESK